MIPHPITERKWKRRLDPAAADSAREDTRPPVTCSPDGVQILRQPLAFAVGEDVEHRHNLDHLAARDIDVQFAAGRRVGNRSLAVERSHAELVPVEVDRHAFQHTLQ